MNIGKAGILMMTYLFIVVLAYIVLSTPFENMIAGFEGLGGNAGTEIDEQVGRSRTMFNIFFGGLAVVPIIWFLIWIMRREADWGFR